jgi:hypothetical protein
MPFAFGPAAPPPERSAELDKHVAKFKDADHFTGPFLDMAEFWEKEVTARAPLFNLDCGFMERSRSDIRPRIAKWAKAAEFYSGSPVKYVEIDDPDEHYARVIIKDAERTFFDETHRRKLAVFLYSVYHEFDAYHQSMSYLAAVCLLALTEQETAGVLRLVKSFIPGHWAAEAVGFATSAWAVEFLMQELFPDVASHFKKLNFWPDTYLQKIMSGLCIHVLKFQELFEFLDHFMAEGMKYLFQFCLAIVERFRDALLRVPSADKIQDLYEIMRLDSKVVDSSDIRFILDRAPKVDLGEWGTQLGPLRSKMYDEKVLPRLRKAPKQEAFKPCEVCAKERPRWWNDDHGAVCDTCKGRFIDKGEAPSSFSIF